MEPVATLEHAGLTIEIVPGEEYEFSNPQDNDNAGTIYSWAHDFDGDERISEPDLELDMADADAQEDDWQIVDLPTYMRHTYDAVLTFGLRFADYGSSGARLYMDADDPNCCLCFTEKEIETEWPLATSKPEDRPESMREYIGGVDGATKYAEARINELDLWLQGNIYGFVVKDGDEVLESVWGFIEDFPWHDPDKSYIVKEAKWAAESCREQLDAEAAEAFRWACADVVTV